jgi:hypothetical protein
MALLNSLTIIIAAFYDQWEWKGDNLRRDGDLLRRIPMNRALSYATRGVAILFAALSCNGTSSVAPDGCVRNVVITVIPGANPVFFWSPACGMSSLSVVTVPSASGSEETMWGFSVPEQKPVGPAIRYGRAPEGSTVWTQPRALVVGTTYRVRVMHTVGGDGLLGTGERTFTR